MSKCWSSPSRRGMNSSNEHEWICSPQGCCCVEVEGQKQLDQLNGSPLMEQQNFTFTFFTSIYHEFSDIIMNPPKFKHLEVDSCRLRKIHDNWRVSEFLLISENSHIWRRIHAGRGRFMPGRQISLSPPEGQNFKRLGWGAESKIKMLSMEINGNP